MDTFINRHQHESAHEDISIGWFGLEANYAGFS